MTPSTSATMQQRFPKCRSFVGEEEWKRLAEEYGSEGPGALSRFLSRRGRQFFLPPFLQDLARLEEAYEGLEKAETPRYEARDGVVANPSLQVVKLSWKNLTCLWGSRSMEEDPQPGRDLALIWRHPEKGDVRMKSASNQDLLALKMVADGIDSRSLAKEQGLAADSLAQVLERAVQIGLLVAPRSKIRRSAGFPEGTVKEERYFAASVFTLQWHLTQTCDLHCTHCYDRSHRYSLKLHQTLEILDDLSLFCKERHVRGQISFTGGNPLLYPTFLSVYRAAKERNFNLAILGNPVSRERIEELSAIEPPLFYQISLEGLERHNDRVRGAGHFQRSLDFLDTLRKMGIYSMVMLTLSRDNIDQVIPLAELLRDKTDLFTFNRLALVGEGANLRLPEKGRYAAFLESYMEAAHSNPIISLKDNLINVIRHRQGVEPFGGCTGYGCGAAFNFLSLLPDGEVHACRKFPSYLGNALLSSLSDIYDSEGAERYRSGCRGCGSCDIRPVCGGCMAIAHSFGLNVFEDKDPFCFMAREAVFPVTAF